MTKILIVEDNKQNSKLYKDLLESHNYTVVLKEDGKDILAILDKERPDVVIIDIMLIGTTGMEVMREIRKSKRFDNLPYVALSAFTASEAKEKALEAGFDMYIEKPIMIEPFLKLVDQLSHSKQV